MTDTWDEIIEGLTADDNWCEAVKHLTTDAEAQRHRDEARARVEGSGWYRARAACRMYQRAVSELSDGLARGDLDALAKLRETEVFIDASLADLPSPPMLARGGSVRGMGSRARIAWIA